MALAAGEIGAMFRVTECNCAGILNREDSIRGGGWVTFFAITRYAEGRLAVMTRAARFPLLHLRHRIADTAASAYKYGTVAFIAFKHLEVVAMAESCVESLETDVHDVFMAFLAFAGDGKSGFSVVAGTAGFTGFHVKHRMPHPIRSGYENLVVTFRTGK